eukprot:5624822-Pyramimonas_sp.AAC.1
MGSGVRPFGSYSFSSSSWSLPTNSAHPTGEAVEGLEGVEMRTREMELISCQPSGFTTGPSHVHLAEHAKDKAEDKISARYGHSMRADWLITLSAVRPIGSRLA